MLLPLAETASLITERSAHFCVRFYDFFNWFFPPKSDGRLSHCCRVESHKITREVAIIVFHYLGEVYTLRFVHIIQRLFKVSRGGVQSVTVSGLSIHIFTHTHTQRNTMVGESVETPSLNPHFLDICVARDE